MIETKLEKLLNDGKWELDTLHKYKFGTGWLILNGRKRYMGQDIFELPCLMTFLSNYDIKSWLEVGVMEGGSFYIWKDLVAKDCKFIGIDHEPLAPIDFLYPTQTFKFIQGHLDTNRKRIVSELNDYIQSVDVVFIDDGHDYDSVKRDFNLFGKYAEKLIIFHDYNIWNGVKELVDELPYEIIKLPPINSKYDTSKLEFQKPGWAIIDINHNTILH